MGIFDSISSAAQAPSSNAAAAVNSPFASYVPKATGSQLSSVPQTLSYSLSPGQNYSHTTASGSQDGFATVTSPVPGSSNLTVQTYPDYQYIVNSYMHDSPSAINSANAAMQSSLASALNAVNGIGYGPTFNAPTYQGLAPVDFTSSLNSLFGQAANAVNSTLPQQQALQQAAATPQGGGINPLFNKATSGYTDIAPNIQSFLDKYGTAQNLYPDQQAVLNKAQNAYQSAASQYNQVDPSQMYAGGNGQPGISNIAQLYGGAMSQFDPYLATGQNAAAQLNTLQGGAGLQNQQSAMTALLNNPIIQNQLQLGETGISNQAGSAGLLRSGEVLKELQSYGQGLAGNAVSSYLGNLQSQLGIGQNAAQSVAGLTNQQQGAEEANATNLANLAMTNNTNQFSQQQAMNSQQLAASLQAQNAMNQGIGLQQANAGGIGQLLAQQSSQELTAQNQTAQAQQAALAAAQAQAGQLSSLYQNQASQTTGAQIAAAQQNASNSQFAYTANAQAAAAQYNSQIAAQQTYLNNITNLLLAQGTSNANANLAAGYVPGTATQQIR